MSTSYGALCSDFYVNQKLALQMDLPSDRESILHMFDSVRRSIPTMTKFRRYHEEVALESSKRDAEYQWLALRRQSVRSGHVNPASLEDAYKFHQLLLKVTPYNLTISPLDIAYYELMFGFDLECGSNHDEVVFDALFGDTRLANLMRTPRGKVVDVQPSFGMTLDKRGDVQAYFEVKTRARSRHGRGRYREEPISLFLTVRRYGPIDKIDDLQDVFKTMAHHCEVLAAEKLVPDLLTPIARQITSSSA